MIFVLLIYILFLAAYAIYGAIAIYHLRRFGYVGDATQGAIIIFSAVSVAIILLSFLYIFSSSWPTAFAF